MARKRDASGNIKLKTIFFVTAILFAACRTADAPPPQNNAPSDAPIKCEADTDCHAGACGPCSPGEVITEMELARECVVNPCGGVAVACRNHICVVR